MRDFNQSTDTPDIPFSFGQTDEIEVDLASPWARMGAVVLNWLFGFLASTPLLGATFFVMKNIEQNGSVIFALPLAMLIPLVYGIWQIVQYSRYGQTLGKKIVGIRVIREDGSNPGFMGVVLREGVYNIILLAITLLIALPLGLTSKNVINIYIYGWILMFASLICVVMLFAVPDRRTLQDMLAKTVVIQLPKDHSH